MVANPSSYPSAPTAVRDLADDPARAVAESHAEALVPIDGITHPQARSFLLRVRALVEEALVQQQVSIEEREEAIRDQAVSIARLERDVSHLQEMAEARAELARETADRLAGANENLRLAIEERDRRLVVFARKLAQVRLERDERSERRTQLLAELRQLKWHQSARRAELIALLEQLA